MPDWEAKVTESPIGSDQPPEDSTIVETPERPLAFKPVNWEEKVSPRPQRVEPAFDSEMGADPSDIAVASLANDPSARLRYYAQERGLPEDRYTVVGDRVAYRTDDGEWFFEAPGVTDIDSFRGAGQWFSGLAGESMPVLAGTAGAIASAPALATGPGAVGSVAFTGWAGATGQAAREYLANKLMGQDVSYGRIAAEGSMAALGQGVGALATKAGNRFLAKDMDKLDKILMESMQQRSAALGIQLTPAEASNLPSLKAKQKMLNNLLGSDDVMDDFYKHRAILIDDAVTKYMDDLSPVDSPEIAGRMVRDAAKGTVEAAKAARQKAAGPLYKEIMTPDNELPEGMLQLINDDAFIMSQIKRVKADKLRDMKDMPDGSLPVLDAVKRKIGDMIGAAKRAGTGDRARLLTEKKHKLTEITDKAFPKYQEARAGFAGRSPEVTALDDSVIGILKQIPDTKLQTAVTKLFDPESTGPKAIRYVRATLGKQSPEAWQAVKRAWIQKQWNRAGREYMSSSTVNQGPKFRALLLGDANRRKVMQAALEKREWAALNDLASVLEAAGRVKPIGSDTAWNQAMMAEARAEATPLMAKAARLLRPQDWGKMMEEWGTSRGLAKNAEQMARIITSPNAAAKLKEINKLPKSSMMFRAELGQLLSQGVKGGFNAVFDSGESPSPAKRPHP